ncbi:MAG TPA: helix-turn-helix transcriptional regulator [Nostocaceae cyanobacterium]|nr:helix-turn-helix transcriptional regulator [Kamptonema sp.]HLO86176.1 helix-turn-helix transcriptional regulator [Nostocaceae cyanobacterium]
MPVTPVPNIADLVRKTRQRLGLSQEKFAAKLGGSFQSVNRWENGKAKPLLLAVMRIEEIVRQMGDRGRNLLAKYFVGAD